MEKRDEFDKALDAFLQGDAKRPPEDLGELGETARELLRADFSRTSPLREGLPAREPMLRPAVLRWGFAGALAAALAVFLLPRMQRTDPFYELPVDWRSAEALGSDLPTVSSQLPPGMSDPGLTETKP